MPKRITVSIDDKVLRFLDNQIGKSNFYNYQHVASYCFRHLAEQKCIFFDDNIAEQIDKLLNSRKVSCFDRTSFILGSVKKQIHELNNKPI